MQCRRRLRWASAGRSTAQPGCAAQVQKKIVELGWLLGTTVQEEKKARLPPPAPQQ
jgi:hypothetical protein